ncbi:hypothetical protein I7X12_19745 [Halosimplex litoreum]|jgi:hypothetical protein|uniref:Major facilitator superfamily (MFS) profile domain-containing protein n=1 Tax=Halosimplex litoreum TaxID=1198301 RepID=A0A7T3FYG9_9EURY|nr:hypothetical protein [Halosimplex litoreum]QPV62917.1 hypothetical protein I7X12_19745 [Halosimplex litoreum]
MSEATAGSDMGIGLGLAFGVLAVAGAVGMLVAYSNQIVAGWSFALAIVGGICAVAAIHLYDGANA